MSKSMRLLTLFFAAVGVASLLSFHFSVPELGGPRNLLPDAEKVTLLDADKVEGLLWSEATLQSHRPLNPSYSYPYAIPYGSNIDEIPSARARRITIHAHVKPSVAVKAEAASVIIELHGGDPNVEQHTVHIFPAESPEAIGELAVTSVEKVCPLPIRA